MRPTEILSTEHRRIEQALDCLERLADIAHRGDVLDVEDFRFAVHFLRTYADRAHHGKEEDQLFPRIRERGVPTHVGPVAVMLQEHDEGRGLISAMDAVVSAWTTDEKAARERIWELASGYVGLMRDHIAKEDNIVFMIAESTLTDADRDELLAAFAAIDDEVAALPEAQELIPRLDELARRLDVVHADERQPSTMSHCGLGGCDH